MKPIIKYGYDGEWKTFFTKEFYKFSGIDQIQKIEWMIEELKLKIIELKKGY